MIKFIGLYNSLQMLVFSLLVSVNVTRKDVNFHGMETVFIISAHNDLDLEL